MLAYSIADAIVAAGIVVVAFAVTKRWPPQELLLGASIGGALSPFVWRAYRVYRPAQPDTTD